MQDGVGSPSSYERNLGRVLACAQKGSCSAGMETAHTDLLRVDTGKFLDRGSRLSKQFGDCGTRDVLAAFVLVEVLAQGTSEDKPRSPTAAGHYGLRVAENWPVTRADRLLTLGRRPVLRWAARQVGGQAS